MHWLPARQPAQKVNLWVAGAAARRLPAGVFVCTWFNPFTLGEAVACTTLLGGVALGAPSLIKEVIVPALSLSLRLHEAALGTKGKRTLSANLPFSANRIQWIPC